ncbi:hypothetical protein PT974_05367 [Cladobotryum mycophilum]|uniref:Uncharacterized protein n=1 Tax=Cladobotryum mycophilum TaxID=491253 RepID=A0ABR0SJR6_9HYPO
MDIKSKDSPEQAVIQKPEKKSKVLKANTKLLNFITGRAPRGKIQVNDLVAVPRQKVENPHVNLIRGYGIPDETGQLGLQPRRTLDQYFYPYLDNTLHRDKDQVVYRYTNQHQNDAKIFMVDQLWLWILNGGK